MSVMTTTALMEWAKFVSNLSVTSTENLNADTSSLSICVNVLMIPVFLSTTNGSFFPPVTKSY